MSGFSFPILSNQELLPCLKEMDLPLTAEQLAKPTFETMQKVYELLVTTLLGVTRCLTLCQLMLCSHNYELNPSKRCIICVLQRGAAAAGLHGYRHSRVS